jgi:hypothetical protein
MPCGIGGQNKKNILKRQYQQLAQQSFCEAIV